MTRGPSFSRHCDGERPQQLSRGNPGFRVPSLTVRERKKPQSGSPITNVGDDGDRTGVPLKRTLAVKCNTSLYKFKVVIFHGGRPGRHQSSMYPQLSKPF